MNLNQLQARVPLPHKYYNSISFIGFLWSQPQLVGQPHFEFAMIELIGSLLNQLSKLGMDELAMETVLNFDVLDNHPILMAIQHKKWDFLELMGRGCASYFAKYPLFALNYGHDLMKNIVNHPQFIDGLTPDELQHVIHWGVPFLMEVFPSRRDMYGQLEESLEGQLVGPHLFVNPHHSKKQIKAWVHILMELLSKDLINMDFINRHILHVENDGARIIDQIILRTDDNQQLMRRYLKFIEALYLKQYISREIYKDLILNHLRDGYSPLHEMVYHSREAQLTEYFRFIEKAVMNGHLLHHEVDEAIRYLNTAGFSLISQASNNHKASVTKIFFEFCEKFYNEQQLMNLLRENQNFIKCSRNKTEYNRIHFILKKYRHMLSDFDKTDFPIVEERIGHMDLSFLDVDADTEVSNHLSSPYVDLSFIDEQPEGTIKFEFYPTSEDTMEGCLVERKPAFGFFEKRTVDSPDSVASFTFK